MRKLKNRFLGYLIAGVLCGSTTSVWAVQMPKLDVSTKELLNKELAMTIQLQQIPKSTKALEIGFVTDDINVIKSANWANQIKDSHTVAKVIDQGGQEKQVTLYITAPKGKLLAEAGTDLILGEFVFDFEVQGIMDLATESGYIKMIDEANEPSLYTQVALKHQHTPREDGSKPDGGGNSSGGNNSKPSDQVKPKPPVVPEIPSVQFLDTQEHWAFAEIGRMAGRGILKGYEDGTFGPSLPITRGEFSAVMTRAFGFKTLATTTVFEDVAVGKWYTEPVVALYEKGIVTGRPNGTFGVNDKVTNEEMAVMLARGLEVLEAELKQERQYIAFLDQQAISPFAKEAVKILYEAGLMNGMSDGTFKPKASVTRAQVAVLMDRIVARVE